MAFASQKDLQNSVLSWPLAIPVDHTLVLPAFSFIGSQCSWNSRTHPFSTRLIKTWNKSRAWLPNGVCTTTQNYFLVGGPHCVLKTMPLPQPLQTPLGSASALSHQVLNSQGAEVGLRSWVPAWGCGVSFGTLSTQKTPGLDTSGKKPLHGQWLSFHWSLVGGLRG